MTTLLRAAPREAKARVERAQDLGPRRALTGEPLPPILPIVAEAVCEGEISAGHVAVISQRLDKIPAVFGPDIAEVAEKLLVDAARHENPTQLAKTAQLLLARLDPDGLPPWEEEIERRRGFTLRKYADGSSDPNGRFTAELTALLETVLDAVAAPVPAVDGMPDDRSPAQRRHDGTVDALRRLLRSGTLPPAGGAPVTVLARTTMSELERGVGVVA